MLAPNNHGQFKFHASDLLIEGWNSVKLFSHRLKTLNQPIRKPHSMLSNPAFISKHPSMEFCALLIALKIYLNCPKQCGFVVNNIDNVWRFKSVWRLKNLFSQPMGWNFVFLSKLHARNKVNSDNFSWFTFFQVETFMVLYCFRFIWNESDECYCSIETSNLKFVNKHAFQMKWDQNR